MSKRCCECGQLIQEEKTRCESCEAKVTGAYNALASRSVTTRRFSDDQWDQFIDLVAVELKKDINYLLELGIKIDKGKLAAKTGGVAWAGYEAFTGDWFSALVVGGISLLSGVLTDGYKRIKLTEMKQKWMGLLSELNRDELNYLMAGLQYKYPLLVGQFQNLLQAGQE